MADSFSTADCYASQRHYYHEVVNIVYTSYKYQPCNNQVRAVIVTSSTSSGFARAFSRV